MSYSYSVRPVRSHFFFSSMLSFCLPNLRAASLAGYQAIWFLQPSNLNLNSILYPSGNAPGIRCTGDPTNLFPLSLATICTREGFWIVFTLAAFFHHKPRFMGDIFPFPFAQEDPSWIPIISRVVILGSSSLKLDCCRLFHYFYFFYFGCFVFSQVSDSWRIEPTTRSLFFERITIELLCVVEHNNDEEGKGLNKTWQTRITRRSFKPCSRYMRFTQNAIRWWWDMVLEVRD